MFNKVPLKSIFLHNKRWYKVAAESASTAKVLVQPAASNVRNVRRTAATETSGSCSGAVATEQEKQVFWIRDPKTGNWIPENHFDGIDAAELREKLLNKPKV